VRRYDVSQIPVLVEDEVVGTVYDAELLKLVLEDPAVMEKPIREVMDRPLPEVDRGEPVSKVARLLAKRNPAVLVRENSGLSGILTRIDVIEYVAE
jgi:cystathionine beta-synthase